MQKPLTRPTADPYSAPPSAGGPPAAGGPPPAELVERCLHGDAAAWRLLVERYVRLVRSIPARQGFSPTEIDDVGQEVFLSLAQNLHQIDDPERLPAWLVTTTRRACWRLLARRRSDQPLEEEADGEDERPVRRELVSPLPTPDEALHGALRQEALRAALGRLGERCRHLLTLVFLDPDEPSYDEISARLAIPKGSIGPTRNRCLQQLRSQLGAEDADW